LAKHGAYRIISNQIFEVTASPGLATAGRLPAHPLAMSQPWQAGSQLTEEMKALQDEIRFQMVLLESIDETVENRAEAEAEVRAEIRTLEKQLRDLRRSTISTTSSRLSGSQSIFSTPSTRPFGNIIDESFGSFMNANNGTLVC